MINVPFTEVQGLIDREQARDITPEVHMSEVLSSLNDLVRGVVTHDDHVYGVPIAASTIGLLYNRDLFTNAGLDPDNPPMMWNGCA